MRKYITQAMIRASIERLELAARTEPEFIELVDSFDRLDERIQEAYEKMVWSTDGKKFDRNMFLAETTQSKGDFLKLLFTCICQMHNLVEDNDLSRLIEKCTFKQKEVFFSRYIRGCSPQRIAVCLDMTDRNVRDMAGKMLTNIRNGLHESLTKRRENGVYLTGREAAFLETYEPKQKQKGKNGGVKK